MGLPGALVLYLVLLISTDKYRADIVSEIPSKPVTGVYWEDIDNDGSTERIEFHQSGEDITSVLVYKNEQLIDQWNFDGKHKQQFEFKPYDYDRDGSKEISLITDRGDSVFLNMVDPVNRIVEAESVFIDTAASNTGNLSYAVTMVGYYDYDQDGCDDYYFVINSGFSKWPRGVYCFNPARNEVISGPHMTVNLDFPYFYDIDGDSVPEILSSTLASGNYGEDAPYTDRYCWLIVLSADLSFRFPPLQLNPYPSRCNVNTLTIRDSTLMVVSDIYRGTGEFESFITLYNHKGRIVGREPVDFTMYGNDIVTFHDPQEQDYLFVGCNNGRIMRLNSDLELAPFRSGFEIAPIEPMAIDIDLDGVEELIFALKSGKGIVITRADLKHPLLINLNYNINILYASVRYTNYSEPAVVISADSFELEISYSLAPLHRYWYLAIILLCLGVTALVFLGRIVMELRRVRRENEGRRLYELQMQAIQNQIDPHFTFNLLESFAGLISEKDTERAEFIFSNYSRLLKATVLNGDKLFIPLGEELQFITSYLELEQFRSRNSFDFSANTCEQVDLSIPVPKMVIHIFVENALKHGIRPLQGRRGNISIDISRNGKEIMVTIADNGVGRKAAAGSGRFSTGRGLEIVDRIIEIADKLGKHRVSYLVEDRTSSSTPEGTTVTLSIGYTA